MFIACFIYWKRRTLQIRKEILFKRFKYEWFPCETSNEKTRFSIYIINIQYFDRSIGFFFFAYKDDLIDGKRIDNHIYHKFMV